MLWPGALCQRPTVWKQYEATVGRTETIWVPELSQIYQYLGIHDSNGIRHSISAGETLICRAYFRRLKIVLRTKLYRNKVLASHQRVCTAISRLQFWRRNSDPHHARCPPSFSRDGPTLCALQRRRPKICNKLRHCADLAL